jgi:hypothetical protein
MKSVQIVAPEYIHSIWDVVEPMLKTAFINFNNADYDVEHIKVLIIEQLQYLFVVVKDEKIIGAFTVEVINYPNHRVAHTTCMGGKGVFDKDTVKQYEDWARLQGASKIRAFAKDSQARLFKLKMGLEPVTHVVEKTL